MYAREYSLSTFWCKLYLPTWFFHALKNVKNTKKTVLVDRVRSLEYRSTAVAVGVPYQYCYVATVVFRAAAAGEVAAADEAAGAVAEDQKSL